MLRKRTRNSSLATEYSCANILFFLQSYLQFPFPQSNINPRWPCSALGPTSVHQSALRFPVPPTPDFVIVHPQNQHWTNTTFFCLDLRAAGAEEDTGTSGHVLALFIGCASTITQNCCSPVDVSGALGSSAELISESNVNKPPLKTHTFHFCSQIILPHSTDKLRQFNSGNEISFILLRNDCKTAEAYRYGGRYRYKHQQESSLQKRVSHLAENSEN